MSGNLPPGCTDGDIDRHFGRPGPGPLEELREIIRQAESLDPLRAEAALFARLVPFTALRVDAAPDVGLYLAARDFAGDENAGTRAALLLPKNIFRLESLRWIAQAGLEVLLDFHALSVVPWREHNDYWKDAEPFTPPALPQDHEASLWVAYRAAGFRPVLCAWHPGGPENGPVLGWFDPPANAAPGPSHGICPDCRDRIRK